LVSLWVLSPTVLQLWAELKKKAIECWNKEVWYSSWKI
jgi:hypothetical protein